MLLKNYGRLGTLLILISIFAAAQNATYEDLSIQISISKNSLPAGSNVELYVDVTNVSSHVVFIPDEGPRAPERSGFEFSVTRPGPLGDSPVQISPYLWAATGRRAPQTSVISPDEPVLITGHPLLRRPLETGKTVRFTAVLNDLFDIAEPGQYDVHVKRYGHMMQPISITITDPPPPAISIVLSAGAGAFPAGSDIDVDIALTNVSNSSIHVPFDPTVGPTEDQNAFTLSLDRSTPGPSLGSLANPHQIRASAWLRHAKVSYEKMTTIEPGQTIHFQADIKKLFDLSSPGVYTLQAHKLDFETYLVVKSNALSITIN